MATLPIRSKTQFAPPSSGRRRSLLRVLSRDTHMLLPSRTAFEPPADVYQTQTEVVVRIEIAGLRETSSDISVEIHEDVVVISGERPDPAAGARQYEQIEVETGRFEKAVRVPCPVSETDAVARYDDGFLVITLPKRAPVRSTVRMVRID